MIEDIRFGHLEYLEYLGLLWAVVLLAVLSIYAFAKKRKAMAIFASVELHDRLTANVGRGRQKLKAVLFIAGVFFVICALIEPQWGVFWKQIHRKGRDIVIVLDTSRSMLAKDVAPNRLERSKLAISDLVETLRTTHGDRIGLVTFAGNATVRCPLTLDYAFFSQMLSDVDTRTQAQGGTRIGDGIRKAVEAFDDKLKNFKDIILITDGEDHETYPVNAAQDASATFGVAIHTVGIGDPAGATIPVIENGRQVLLTHEGAPVLSKLAEGTLREIANYTGGVYVPAQTKDFSLDKIYQEKIAKKEARETEETKRERYTNRYQWFLALGFLLIAAEPLIGERKRK